MTTILLDTSFLYALNDSDDQNHQQSIQWLTSVKSQTPRLVAPVTVLPEVCYLLATRLNHALMRRFLAGLSTSEILLETLTAHDLREATFFLTHYADAKLDFVDATLVAIAERLAITRIATFDRRDFSIIRPRHATHFDLLP